MRGIAVVKIDESLTTLGSCLTSLTRGVAGPAVADHGAAAGDHRRDEAAQAWLSSISPPAGTRPCPTTAPLHSRGTAIRSSPSCDLGLGTTRFWRAKGQAGLVRPDQASERLRRDNHGDELQESQAAR